MPPFADLHTHTTYSDGRATPAELVEAAEARGLSALAVTDHDTVDAWPDVQAAARRCGIELLTGVELSVVDDGEEVHLLGYGFRPDDPGLTDHLAQYRAVRRERAEQIVERLQAEGVAIAFADVARQVAEQGVFGRPHVAAALVEGGHVASTGEAFRKYLQQGEAAYVAKPEFPAHKALSLLHEAGGIGVLAHPGHHTSHALVKRLIRAGLDGIEVAHPSHDRHLVEYYRRLARDYDLVETGGSDYHGHPETDDTSSRRFGAYGVRRSTWERIRRAVA
jgi:hypothetical protein